MRKYPIKGSASKSITIDIGLPIVIIISGVPE